MKMNKIALVTGATSGIGEACARKLAMIGYNMIITGRRAERLDAVAHDLSAMGVGVITLEFDVRDRESANSALASARSCASVSRSIAVAARTFAA